MKSLHRFNFGRPVKIEKFTPRRHVWDYFRLLAHLIRVRGFAGWVILFDEFELVGTLGVMARGEAYWNLGRFLFPGEGAGLEATYAIFSTFSGFWSVRLLAERRPDLEGVPARLLAKGEPRKAETVRRVLNTLLQEPVNLEPLTPAEIRRMLEKVAELHARAYGWEPAVDLDKLLTVTKHARLRTKIRYMLEYLDLKYLSGKSPRSGREPLLRSPWTR